MHARSVRDEPSDHGVSGFVIRGLALVFRRDDFIALEPERDLFEREIEVGRLDDVFVVARGPQGRFVDEVADIGAGESGRRLRELVDVDVG